MKFRSLGSSCATRTAPARKGLVLCSLLFAFLAAAVLRAQTPPCWYIPTGSDGEGRAFNPDTVAVDTCGMNYTTQFASPMLDADFILRSADEGRLHAKRWFALRFDVDALPLPWAPPGTVLEAGWQDIDSGFGALRAALENLETTHGSFTFQKLYPDVSAGQAGRQFLLSFDDYVSVSALCQDMAAIADISMFTFLSSFVVNQDIPNDRGMKPGSEITDIQPANPQTKFPKNYHREGWHWNLYRMNCPMAWEITRGRPEIVVAARDTWRSPTQLFTTVDMPIRDDLTPAKSGNNFLQLNAVTRGNSLMDITSELPGIDRHGVRVLGIAIAKADNDNLDSTPAGAMVGVCPECSGMGLDNHDHSIILRNYSDIDTDFDAANGTLQRIAVVNQSQIEADAESTLKNQIDELIGAGIVYIAAAGNGQQSKPPRPAANSWSGTEAGEDYKVISVGSTQDGLRYDGACMAIGFEAEEGPASPANGQYWLGPERFMNFYSDLPGEPCCSRPAFSLGLDKFSTAAAPEDRLAAKELAFMDLCAPGTDVLNFQNQTDVEGIYDPARVYRVDNTLTSQATPMVSGICGLMLSVNRLLGVPFDAQTGLPTGDGAEVQRRAYNILSFTADKVIDNGIDYRYNSDSGELEEVSDPNLDQPQYLEQANDRLKRSWAQRMGFGRVNAYRAVAHSIRNKADYSYGAATTLPFAADDGAGDARGYVNENGTMLMHMGAWVNELHDLGEDRDGNQQTEDVLLDVLEFGGRNFPVHTAATDHNNQGLTRLQGSGTILTVPPNAVLAVDGILLSENPTGNNKIVTSGDGKILLSGWLQDVEIVGNSRISDLTISSGAAGNGCLWIGGAGASGSELYGRVEMRDFGQFIVHGGTLAMQPGGTLHMNGERDLTIEAGGTLRMNYSSMITGPAERRVVVKAGSKLIIREGARADIFAHVLVEAGGELIVERNAYLGLDRFTVEANGSLTLREGCQLSLLQTGNNVCKGHLDIRGTANNAASITAKLLDCCKIRENCLDVSQAAAILSQGDLENTAASSLRITDAHISNVAVRAVNVRSDAIRNSVFEADRTHFTAPALLSLLYDESTPGMDVPEVRSVRVEDCTFRDREGEKPGDRILQFYNFNGIDVSAMRQVSIRGCDFSFLRSGIATNTCSAVELSANSAQVCNEFQMDVASGFVRECANSAYSVNAGSAYTETAASEIFGNSYSNVEKGVEAVSSDRHWNRGSSFENFVIGVRGDASSVNLLPRLQTPANTFGGNTFSAPPDALENDFIDDPLKERWDLGLDKNAELAVSCGFNDLAQLSTYHIFSRTATSVDVSHNKWQDPNAGHFVRKNALVSVSGAPLDQSGPESGCEVEQPSLCLPPPHGGSICLSDLLPMDGTWPVHPSSSPALDDIFENARTMMQNTGLHAMCRRAKARDAFHAALLGDSLIMKMNVLIIDYEQIIQDPASPDLLTTAVLLLKGQAREQLGDPVGAAQTWGIVTAAHPQSADSLPAAWKLQRLAAVQNNPGYGPGYDLAMNAYHRRVSDDLRRFTTPVGGAPLAKNRDSLGGAAPGDAPAEEPAAASLLLEQNVPNPFGGRTRISFELPRDTELRLLLVDLHGHVIAVLRQGRTKAGRHSIDFDAGALAPGVYAYRLETDAEVRSRMMLILPD